VVIYTLLLIIEAATKVVNNNIRSSATSAGLVVKAKLIKTLIASDNIPISIDLLSSITIYLSRKSMIY